MEVSSKGLGVFRILFGVILFLEVFQLYYFKNLIFDPIPFLQTSEFNLGLFFFFWMLALTCLILGLFTTYSSLLNYICCLCAVSFPSYFSYHFDYFILTTSFLLMVLPVSRSFSLDRILHKITSPEKISVGNIYVLFILVVVFSYTDSFLNKLEYKAWTAGLGFWLPASLPQITFFNLSWVLDIKFIALALGYTTLALQLLVPVLFFFRKSWPYLGVAGLICHLGIAIAFPIPLFGVGFSIFFILLLPETWWERMGNLKTPQWLNGKLKGANSRTENFSSGVEEIEPKFKSAGKKVIIFFLAYAFISQVLCTSNAYIIRKILGEIGLAEFQAKAYNAAYPLRIFNQNFLGITSHGLFPEDHFAGYNHCIAIAYVDKEDREHFLPIINESGHVPVLNSGRLFCEWSFNINGPEVNKAKLTEGVKKYTAYWGHILKLDTATRFLIKVKKIDTPVEWEQGVLIRNEKKPWLDGGFCYWNGKEFVLEIKDIESL